MMFLPACRIGSRRLPATWQGGCQGVRAEQFPGGDTVFRVRPSETDQTYRAAVAGLLILSTAALGVTVWVMIDFLREQEIVEQLIRQLPREAADSAEELAGELRWQFRLTALVVLNLVVTGFAVVLLWRAYRSSQESLRDIKALTGDILSSMDQAVITTDSAGTVTSINRRGLELLEPDGECVGRPLAELSAELPLDTFRQDWIRDRSEDPVRDFQTVLRGSRRTLRGYCQPLTNNEGREIGLVLQLRDVTDRVLAEERMRRMERYMGLGSLAAGLHHEIKNPLAALSLHVQLLEEQLEETNPGDDINRMLGVIRTEVARVGGVLEGFRDFASIGRLNRETVDLKDLIRRQIRLIQPQAGQQNVTADMCLPDGPLTVSADRVRLEQVLLNLLVNAMDAMPDGGRLTVTATASDQTVEIEVADTGCGIPEDQMDRVLDPYFTTKSSGTGLGLALCDKIVRQHNGSLDFRSSDCGTVFRVTLPRHPEVRENDNE